MKQKIIHVITRLDKGGSAEDTIVAVIGSNKELYDVLLVRGMSEESNMGNEEEEALKESLIKIRQNGVPIIDMPALVRRASPLKDLFTLWKLFLLFRQERPDIVHTHTSKAGLLGRWAAFFTKVPTIIHTPHGHVFHGYFNRPVTKFYIFLEQISAKITDRIIAVSDREKAETLAEKIGNENSVTTIYSGVELERFLDRDIDTVALKKELGIAPHYKIIGTIGRLIPIKGYTYLIEAASTVIQKHPETLIVMVGEGELREDLRNQAKGAGISDNLIFLGWRADVADILYLFDIFVLPSLNEGMGKVLVEVMAAAKPIVASRVGGIIDLVHDNKTGLLVTPANADEIRESIIRILDDEKLAKRLGKAGRELAYPKFDASVMIEKIEKVYQQCSSKQVHQNKK